MNQNIYKLKNIINLTIKELNLEIWNKYEYTDYIYSIETCIKENTDKKLIIQKLIKHIEIELNDFEINKWENEIEIYQKNGDECYNIELFNINKIDKYNNIFIKIGLSKI